MWFRLNIGGSGARGFGMGCVPQYHMPYWVKVGDDEERVVYRPTLQTLLHHLWLSFLAVFVLSCAVYYSGWPWSTEKEDAREQARRDTEAQKVEFKQQTKPLMDELKGQLSPEVLAELERKQAADQKQRDAELAKLRSQRSVMDRFLWGVYWLFFCCLVWVAVMPIVTLPLKQVTFARSADDELIIRSRRFFRRERRWPLRELRLLDYRVEEERASLRMTTYTVGWWWIARIISEGGGTIEFYLERQKQRPTDLSRLPRSIESFLKQMQRLTRVQEISVPQEISERRRGRFHTRFGTTTIESEQVVHTETYHSLDEVPDYLRGDVEEMSREMGPNGQVERTSIRVTVRDSEGNKRTYHSLEEMPAEVRERYERAVRKRKRKRRG